MFSILNNNTNPSNIAQILNSNKILNLNKTDKRYNYSQLKKILLFEQIQKKYLDDSKWTENNVINLFNSKSCYCKKTIYPFTTI